MSPSPAATGWTGRPYTGGVLGGLAVLITGAGWLYVVLAVLGLCNGCGLGPSPER